MENAKNPEKPKTDWTKKGRGWIPDLPDFRDYKLDHTNILKGQRLRTEEVIGSIEDLAESLLKTFKNMKVESKHYESLTTFRNQASGNIYIRELNIYRILRQPTKKENQHSSDREKPNKFLTQDREKPERNLNDSIFLNQIAELKNYLNFLVLRGHLQTLSEEERKHPCFAKYNLPDSGYDLKDAAENAKWLTLNEFDDTTRQLVMLFQLYSGIRVDGIVGVQSHISFNEYFTNPQKHKVLKKRAEEYKECLKKSQGSVEKKCKESQKKIKLQTVPIALPLQIFTALLTKLRRVASKQIWLEYSRQDENSQTTTKDKLESSFSEDLESGRDVDLVFSEHLKEIFEESYKSHSSEYFSDDADEEIEEEKFTVFFEKILHDNKFSESNGENLDNIIKVFYREFYAIEPIISMVFKVISPLANYQHLSIQEMIDLGFQKFHELFYQSCSLDESSQNSENLSKVLNGISSAFKDDSKDLKLQAQHAVKKALQLFYLAMEQLVLGDGNLQQEKEEFNRILLFYLLLKKYLKKYLNCLDCANEAQMSQNTIDKVQAEQDDIEQSYVEPNFFDKQDFFVIKSMQQNELHQSDEQIPEHTLSKKPHDELFNPGKLVIPVSDSFLNRMNFKDLKSFADLGPYFSLPGCVDLSFWCPKIEDQGSLNSCSAFAGIALYEYFVNRSSGQYDDVSPLFLYKAARQLMKIDGDGGASVRDTMKAMALFGIPPESSWPYRVENLDKEPPSFCYAYAQNYQALKYFRLDYAGIPNDILLFEIKAIMAAGFPCMFGFTLYSSALEDPNPQKGYIPFPDANKDKIVDGHAVVAVGYDDLKILRRANPEEPPTRGAILIRNSWGSDWGNQGYGWLPYEYVLAGLTAAWWSLLKAEWFKGSNFGFGGKSGDETPDTGQD